MTRTSSKTKKKPQPPRRQKLPEGQRDSPPPISNQAEFESIGPGCFRRLPTSQE